MLLSELTSLTLLISLLVFPLIYFIEEIGSQFFMKYFYNFGFTILIKYIDTDTSKIKKLTDRTIKMRIGKFRFISSNEVLFTPRWYLFNFSAKSIFPIRATANVSNQNQLMIHGRIPVGSTLFLLSWSFGWFVCNILLFLFDDHNINLNTLIPLVIGVIIGYICYLIEKRRFKIMLKELQEIITLGSLME